MPEVLTGEEFASDFLEHHGIKGMKWGVIRTKTQSAVSRGKEKVKESKEKHEAKKSEKAAANKAKTLSTDEGQRLDRVTAKKSRRTLSDSEIQSRITRLEKEKRLKELTDEDLAPGKTATKKIIIGAVKTTATAALPGLLAYAGKKVVTNALNNPELADAMFSTKKDKKKAASDTISIGKKLVQGVVETKGSSTSASSTTPKSTQSSSPKK